MDAYVSFCSVVRLIITLNAEFCTIVNLFLQAQIGLLVILLVAMADFMIGTFVGPRSDEAKAKGFLGYDCK